MIYLAGVTSNAVAGSMVQRFGIRVPFRMLLGLGLALNLWVLICPETIRDEDGRLKAADAEGVTPIRDEDGRLKDEREAPILKSPSIYGNNQSCEREVPILKPIKGRLQREKSRFKIQDSKFKGRLPRENSFSVLLSLFKGIPVPRSAVKHTTYI